jgi:hypothetical protein
MANEKKINFPIPKNELEFQFRTHNFKDILKKTTEDVQENLWKHCVHFDIDLTCMQGQDPSMDGQLDQLKNKYLVYSSMLHFLGRSIFCSRPVYERYALLLKRRFKDIQTDIKAEIEEKIRNVNLEDILTPYAKSTSDFCKWKEEPIAWMEYAGEISVKELFASKLREKCSKYELGDSTDFFVDFLASLHIDNYCFKTLKRGKTDQMFVEQREYKWGYPLATEIRSMQQRTLQGHRRDYVLYKNQGRQGVKSHNYIRMEIKNVDRDLDPYLHGGHFRATYSADPNTLDYYIKNHPGKQIITEV